MRVNDDHERAAWELIFSFEDKDFSYM